MFASLNLLHCEAPHLLHYEAGTCFTVKHPYSLIISILIMSTLLNSNVPSTGNKVAGKPLTDERIKAATAKPTNIRRPTRKKRGMFMKGPIPIAWLGKASQLDGKCLAVGIVLWFIVGLKRRQTVKLERKWLLVFRIGRGAVGRCLEKLEGAGLISVERSDGRCPIVTIQVVEDEDKAA